MAGKIVYDFNRVYTESCGDSSIEVTTKESECGEWPACLPKELKKRLKISQSDVFERQACSCGRHVVFCLNTPSEVWHENQEKRIRAIEEK